jgi:hypothetical protein
MGLADSEDWYKVLRFSAGPFMWRYGNEVFLQLELEPVIAADRSRSFNIIMYIYNEEEARQHASRSDNGRSGTFYRTTPDEMQRYAPGKWVSFPTRNNYAVTIQKAFRGMKGRRRADQAREEYYRPGGRGYLAAMNGFAARAANRAAKRVRR